MVDPRLSPAALEQDVRESFEVFEDWIRGLSPGTPAYLAERWESRFHPAFRMVIPGGAVLGLEELVTSVAESHGSNPSFRATFTDFRVVATSSDLAIVSYEEWQRGARTGLRPDNGRLSTAALTLPAGPGGLRWVYLQQTWMAPEQLARFPRAGFRD